jgi:hypothetical protein
MFNWGLFPFGSNDREWRGPKQRLAFRELPERGELKYQAALLVPAFTLPNELNAKVRITCGYFGAGLEGLGETWVPEHTPRAGRVSYSYLVLPFSDRFGVDSGTISSKGELDPVLYGILTEITPLSRKVCEQICYHQS